jgi:HD-GYP domain-containing protein (c-di-GMP phosphodiesterase class II)
MRDVLDTLPGLMPALGSAIATYDDTTALHGARVGLMAAAVGEMWGLGGDEPDWLQWAGVLHDVGKLAIARAMLRKEGPFTEREWAEIRRHPTVGSQLLWMLSPALEPVATAVESHHERWDGTGYPRRLAGRAIPLSGRIVAVADTFDAMTSRPGYRGHVRSREEAVTALKVAAGWQLDPALVTLFVELVEQGRIEE